MDAASDTTTDTTRGTALTDEQIAWRRWWIAELRSGDRTQCKRHLHLKGDGYCCLGVFAELADGPGAWTEDTMACTLVNGGSFLDLPRRIMDLAGLTQNEQASLINLNDGGKTFPEIADWLEARLP